MLDIQLLIDHAASATGFRCDWSKETQPNLPTLRDIEIRPMVMFGALNIVRESDIATTGSVSDFTNYADELTLVISVHIVTTQKMLHTHWKILHDALLGWVPGPAVEKNFSALTYFHGEAMGVSNSRIWWLDQWKLSFPAITY